MHHAALLRESRRPVAIWLFTLAAMVAAMVALGGLTRLTGSGLSMVEWNPHHLLPPLTGAEWDDAFAKYQATPEYRLVNAGMDLAGFQSIFWLEYVHRLWGRLIGFAFALPLAYFAWCRLVDRPLLKRLGLIFALGAGQGGLGWFMVASGLVDHPEVSHFRLAAHLAVALLILAALLWTALDLAGTRRPAPCPAWLAASLVMTTITWGAFVAGLDAGLVYNTFPLMAGQWLPGDGLDILHAHGAVQFAHRVLAVTTVLALTLLALRWRPAWPAAAWSWGQAALGIATLLLHVPIALAVLHQMGAVMLVALLTWALHGTERRKHEFTTKTPRHQEA
ncbi:MAG TPA: COX15/CtaA family protein [Candidatus Omnitrophota bacterium]|nr:COX15/CtaA family protein [Candidatus Omnitrophota bacterium]